MDAAVGIQHGALPSGHQHDPAAWIVAYFGLKLDISAMDLAPRARTHSEPQAWFAAA